VATLQDLKQQIEEGATATLQLVSPLYINERMIDAGVHVLISHNNKGYTWALDRVTVGYPPACSHHYQFGPDWEKLLERIQGPQTESDQWMVKEAAVNTKTV
jgi:hypothetical protein